MSASPQRDPSPSQLHSLSAADHEEDDESFLSDSTPPWGLAEVKMSPKRSLELDDEDESQRATQRSKRARLQTHVTGTTQFTIRNRKSLLDTPYATLPRYLKLFKQDVQNLLGNGVRKSAGARNLDDVFGLIEWNAEEKDKFFKLLMSQGRHDLARISHGLRTKSVVEVADYLRHLKDAYVQTQRTKSATLLRYDQFPPAAEIPEDLEAVLDRLADTACKADDKEAIEDEEELNGEYAVLNADNAHVFYEEQQEADGRDKDAMSVQSDDSVIFKDKNLTAATSVLDLPRMLELSQYVFMNSKHEDEHWQTLAKKSEVPSILQTALLDIYELVASFTQRLVSTAHFLALSRIRMIDTRSTREALKEVRAKDVTAAASILKVPFNAKDFWVKCPRKCRLRVYKGRNGTSQAAKLSYEQVEQVLSEEGRWPQLRSGHASVPLNDESHEDDQEDDDVADDASISSLGSQSTHASSRTVPRATSNGSRDADLDQEEDSDLLETSDFELDDPNDIHTQEAEYVEAVDFGASRAEEALVRAAIYGKNDANIPTVEHVPTSSSLPKRVKIHKTLEDLVNWADGIEFGPQGDFYTQAKVQSREALAGRRRSRSETGGSGSERSRNSSNAGKGSDGSSSSDDLDGATWPSKRRPRV